MAVIEGRVARIPVVTWRKSCSAGGLTGRAAEVGLFGHRRRSRRSYTAIIAPCVRLKVPVKGEGIEKKRSNRRKEVLTLAYRIVRLNVNLLPSVATSKVTGAFNPPLAPLKWLPQPSDGTTVLFDARLFGRCKWIIFLLS